MQAHRALQDGHASKKLPTGRSDVLGEVCARHQRAEVGEAKQSARAPHLRHKDCRIWLIELAGRLDIVGCDRELAALGFIQNAAEQRRGVESGRAQPGNPAVSADECRRRPITDQAMVFDRQIATDSIERSHA